MAGRDRPDERPRRVRVADRPVHDRRDPAGGRARRRAPGAAAPRAVAGRSGPGCPPGRPAPRARRWSSSATAGSAGRSPGSPRRTACAWSRSRPTRPSAPTTASGCPGTGDPDGSIPDRIVGIDALREVAAEADFLSITLPLTERSRGVVSREVLAALPAHAWIINTGRGPVVDEAALAEALAAGGIGGAVLDVFGEEPLPPASPFWGLPNVVITPHVSGRDHGAPRPARQREPAALRRRRTAHQSCRSRTRVLNR